MAETSKLTLEELPRKIKNEKRMKRELKEVFRQMSDELMIGLAATGFLIPLDSFTKDVEAVLRSNYRQTARDFKFTARDRFDIDRAIDAGQIDESINTFIKRTAPVVATQIMNTTSEVARKAESDIRLAAEEEGRALSVAETAILVGTAFATRNRKRVDTIAQTEIQNISESSKDIEANALINSGNLKAKKMWDAILDSKTRPAHARADGQVRDTDQPFNVGGERLKFPRDTSLGATAGNVIKCRCSSQLVKTE